MPRAIEIQSLLKKISGNESSVNNSIVLQNLHPREEIIKGVLYFLSDEAQISFNERKKRWEVSFISRYSTTSAGHPFSDPSFQTATIELDVQSPENPVAVLRVYGKSDNDYGDVPYEIIPSDDVRWNQYIAVLEEKLNTQRARFN